VITIFIKSNF